MEPSPPMCVCGAALDSEECRLRAHLRGPRSVVDEREAFTQVVTYHYRRDSEPDRCAVCGPISLGSSFPEHQWDEFVKMRTR